MKQRLKQNDIAPQKAIEILKKNNIDIDEKQAKKVLDLFYFLAKLIVNQNFK